MKRIFRQPLLHFLAIGALIFAVNSWLNPVENVGEQAINVSASRITALARNWEARRMRPPNPDELRDLVRGYIREEVLYREAKKLGLDQDDAVVRRRLAQKMEFLFRDLQGSSEPDEQTLRKYYEAHAQRYVEPARLSFRQVYFSPDRRGKAAMSSARSALASLRKGGSPTQAYMGDPSMLESTYKGLSRQQLRGRFGGDFAAQLMALPIGQWLGPIPSAYGLHLVRVEQRTDARQPPLAEVRKAILRDYMREKEQEGDRAFYRKLKSNYQINIEKSELLPPPANQPVGHR